MTTTTAATPIVDVHTHIYPPSYIALLSSRTAIPYIHQPQPTESSTPAAPRLIILPSDDDPSKPLSARGRPIDQSYSSWDAKLKFMSTHGITHSVVSLANPWLDWLAPGEALLTAQRINNDLNAACGEQDLKASSLKLSAFACLPLSAPIPDIVSEIHRLKLLKYIKGVIMGTTGVGRGLDDATLEPVWSALAATRTLVFLHPHYGLPDAAFGGEDSTGRYGHVLPLALGFPLETTIAMTRMYLAGVFDRHLSLEMLLAHSGGALPFLAGRIQSCVEHEREFVANGGDKPGPTRSIWDVLRTNIYLDAVIYGKAGLKAAIEAGGVDRIMFGTDHPFFPPLKTDGADERWLSVVSNVLAIDQASEGDIARAKMLLGGNAMNVLKLDE